MNIQFEEKEVRDVDHVETTDFPGHEEFDIHLRNGIVIHVAYGMVGIYPPEMWKNLKDGGDDYARDERVIVREFDDILGR